MRTLDRASALSWICAVLLLVTCSRRDAQFRQYYVQGEALYVKHCANCHQKNGEGLGLLYPPVNRSDYMDHYYEDVICLMKYGKQGEIVVNGDVYNQPMPGIPTMTDLEIAELATYLYNNWSRERGLISVTDVSPILQQCHDAEP